MVGLVALRRLPVPRLPLVRSDPRGRPGLLLQVALITAFLIAYDALRNLAPGRFGLAHAHATSVLALEGHLHLDAEHAVNDWVAARHLLALVASTFYDSAHYLITLPLLALVYVRCPEHYRRVRDVLVVTNVVGLIGFAAYPLAPPRFLPGYHDTVLETQALGGWGKTIATEANEYAAMPSLHEGWALWCVVVAFTVTASWWLRALALTHAAVTLVVIVGTGNHYVLDAVAGGGCLAVALVVVWGARVVRRQRGRPDALPPVAAVAPRAESREPACTG